MTHAASALKKLREKYDLSQGDVAKIVGDKTCQAVSNAERSIASFPAHWIGKLQKKLKLSHAECLELLDAKVFDVHNEYLKESGLRFRR